VAALNRVVFGYVSIFLPSLHTCIYIILLKATAVNNIHGAHYTQRRTLL